MKWVFDTPTPGTMVRVKVGSIYHYGVFVSDTEVIQFGLAPVARPELSDRDIEVCTSDIDTFLCGGFLEVAEFDRAERRRNRRPKDAVAYARSKLGTRGYNILYNNCEHFAYDCVTGTPYCSQTADVRAFFRSLPVVNVYVAAIPEHPVETVLEPPARQAELDAVNNPRVKAEKRCVWQLLAYALEHSFGHKLSELELTKSENGRWSSTRCDFSLSHADGVVAVAVSRAAVGIDVEGFRPTVKERFADKILNGAERALFDATPECDRIAFLIRAWTAKEALFKHGAVGSTFSPREHDSLSGKVRTQTVTVNGRAYALSVASDTPEALRVYTDIDLSEICARMR